jgi:hypothetical protein
MECLFAILDVEANDVGTFTVLVELINRRG